jgi:NADPH2:quinone reductase
VVNYREAGATYEVRSLAPGGVDRIVEVALTTNLDLDVRVMAENASIVCYATEDTDPVVPSGRLLFANTNLRYVLVYRMPASAMAAAVTEVTAAAPDLVPLPFHRFPLEEIAAAHDAVEAGAVGKVLVDIST